MASFLPPATIGVAGGGQLGRMLTMAAKQLGYRVVCLDPEEHSPAGQVADEQLIAELNYPEAVNELARRSDVLTGEFENPGAILLDALASCGKPVFPSVASLRLTQNRLAQKEFLLSRKIPVTRFMRVENEEELSRAAKEIGFPAVLKTASLGFDGKGQTVLNDEPQAREAFLAFGGAPLIWEKLVPFIKEVSVMAVRSESGQIAIYPVVENIHKDSILDTTIAPGRISALAASHAHDVVKKLAAELDVIGVFCTEMFLLPDDLVMVNEIALRPHNSGHYTIDACFCSQFEQQVRAICGLPLGSTEMHSAAAMLNILGTGRGNSLSGIPEALADPRVHLHLYGKKEAKEKRKMGHVTAVAADGAQALSAALAARSKLSWTS